MKTRTKLLMPIILAALVLPLAGVSTAWAQDPGPIHAEVDRTALSTGETLLLTITASSTSIFDAPRPQMPDLQGFNVVGTSTSSQISIINGAITSQVLYLYQLQPYEAGELVIAPVRLTLGGQTYSTQPITVQVSQGSRAPAPTSPPSNAQQAVTSEELSGQDLFVEALVDNPAPYVGEQVTYSFLFYEAANLSDQPQYQPPAFTGFWSEPLQDQQEYRIQAGGRTYRVTELRTILFPSVVGSITIEPARLVIPGGFFNRGQTLQTKPVDLNVQPLPPGAPESFAGAVGQFSLQATLDATSGAVNEPLTWHVTLSGQGNFNAAPDPAWPEIDGWRSFESEATLHTEVRDGELVGSRTYERLLVPSVEGETTLPALQYAYFDPATGQYQVIQTEPIAVSIAAGDPGAAGYQPATGNQDASGDLAAADPKQPVEQLASDIRHLKPVPAHLGASDQPLAASGLYWAAWAFPLVGAAGFFAWQRRQRYLENNLDIARSSQARKKARKALSQARKQNGNASHAAGQILMAYLADKLNQPVAGLTHQALAGLLAERGLQPNLVERVDVLLVTSELGRFAPGADEPDHTRSLLQEVDTLIAALEKEL
jgi:hypothetical protein